MIRFNELIDCTSRDEIIAVFLEDDPEATGLEDSLYCGYVKDIPSFEHYSKLENLPVERLVTRFDSDGQIILCVGLVC